MHKSINSIATAFALALTSLSATAQSGPERTYFIPIKLPTTYLAGNFAELRPNHFHSGIDLKTQGVIGQPVYSMDEGWVSRVGNSLYGYGNVVYVTHYDGLTTVYAHLDKFSPKIAAALKEYQYKHEQAVVDAEFAPGEIPVGRGEEIAKSGNTGSSVAPHLHFEVRDSDATRALDPLLYFADKVTDTTPPELRAVRVYPIDGVVNGSASPVTATPTGAKTLSKPFTAWGRIGIGFKGVDRMDNTTNIYGIKTARLFVDDSLRLSMQHNSLPFADTRYLNSLIDYADWQQHRGLMTTKLFVDPGNKLGCYRNVADRGEIVIDEERPYAIRIELQDLYGNKTVREFTITGKRQAIPERRHTGVAQFAYDKDNTYAADRFFISIPQGMLYTDLDFTHAVKPRPAGAYAELHVVGSPQVPLHSYVNIAIDLTQDPLADKSKYYIARIDGDRHTCEGGSYADGSVRTRIRAFGNYTVLADTVAPVVTLVSPETWSRGTIRLTASDAHSGLKSLRGEIDGKYALFTTTNGASYSYTFDPERVEKGQTHTLRIVATDMVGNEKVVERKVKW